MTDVETRRPVADLEVTLSVRRGDAEEESSARTDADGVVAWSGIPTGALDVRIHDQGYRPVVPQGLALRAGRPSLPFPVRVERWTTLRLRFEHDDGTPVGAVVHDVTGARELTEHDAEVPPRHDFEVRTGDGVGISAWCEDGYEGSAAFSCEAWPLEERTIRLSPVAPRGRTSVRVEVAAAEGGGPVAGATVACSYEFRRLYRWWEATTDANGAAILEDLPTAGETQFFAYAAGWSGGTLEVDLDPGSPRLLRFVIERRACASVTGACPDRPQPWITLTNERGNEVRHVYEPPQGEFAFEDLAPGSYTLVATDPASGDVATAAAEAPGPPVRISFPPAGRLVLDCRDALGRVPAEIAVRVEGEGRGEGTRTMCPEGGRFPLPPMSQGPVRVSVTSPGYRKSAVVPVHVVGDATTEVAIPLGDPLPVLDVLVVDPDGVPVRGVAVHVSSRVASPPFDDGFFGGNAALPVPETQVTSEKTAPDGWVRFVRDLEEPGEFDVHVGFAAPGAADAPDPFRRTVRLGTTGRATATFPVTPRPRIEAGPGDVLPAGLLDGDLLVEWNGSPLRLAEEIPPRWTEPVVVTVARGKARLTVTLPPMTRGFAVGQALLPPP